MNTALVIFNGIQFSYKYAQHVIDWAEENKADIHALFIHSVKEPPEGYMFPSDLDAAENLNDDTDARRNDLNVINAQIKLFSDMARTKNKSVRTDSLIDPELDEVLKFAREATILFLDANYDKAVLLACISFRLKQLIAHAPCPVEVVGNEN